MELWKGRPPVNKQTAVNTLISRTSVKTFTGLENFDCCPSRNSDSLISIIPPTARIWRVSHLTLSQLEFDPSQWELLELDKLWWSQISPSTNLMIHSQNLVVTETNLHRFEQVVRNDSCICSHEKQHGQEKYISSFFFPKLTLFG